MPPVVPQAVVPGYTHISFPKLKIHIEDLDHEGADVFLKAVKPNVVLRKAIEASMKHLFTPETMPTNVEEILLVLRSMEGVAHTTGSRTHKEIHYSLEYIANTKDRAEDEITGVLVHEVVHCFQYNRSGTCPGGVIEGIADFVRLRAGCAPPHWRKDPGLRPWHSGYDLTAYFLDWIEKRQGEINTIRNLNLALKDNDYEDELIRNLTGTSVDDLWKEYLKE